MFIVVSRIIVVIKIRLFGIAFVYVQIRYFVVKKRRVDVVVFSCSRKAQCVFVRSLICCYGLRWFQSSPYCRHGCSRIVLSLFATWLLSFVLPICLSLHSIIIIIIIQIHTCRRRHLKKYSNSFILLLFLLLSVVFVSLWQSWIEVHPRKDNVTCCQQWSPPVSRLFRRFDCSTIYISIKRSVEDDPPLERIIIGDNINNINNTED